MGSNVAVNLRLGVTLSMITIHHSHYKEHILYELILPFNGDFIAASINPANSCSDLGSCARPLENAAKASA